MRSNSIFRDMKSAPKDASIVEVWYGLNKTIEIAYWPELTKHSEFNSFGTDQERQAKRRGVPTVWLTIPSQRNSGGHGATHI